MPSWKQQFWELHHQHACLCLLHPLAVLPNSCPCYHWYDQPFWHSSPVSVWNELICLQRWEHFLVSAPLVQSTAVRMPVCIKTRLFIELTCCLLQHSCSVCQMLCFTFYSLKWSVNSSSWWSFPSDLVFIGCRETGADGIDTSPRPARMRLSPQSGQMLMMDSWTRFVVCWCSVRILHKCMSVMTWQEVFAWDGLGRKMRKAGHEWEKNGEADLSCSMKRSCLRVNDSEWRGHQLLLLCMRSCWFQRGGRNVGGKPKRLVPCLGPHGMTKKAEFLWTSSDTPHVGALFFLCMRRTVVVISSGVSGY